MKLAKVFSTVIAACTIAIAPPAQATESANCGVQVVVETHSDQILNGIRLAVHGEKIEPEDVQLHYFQRQENQGQTFIKVVSPRIALIKTAELTDGLMGSLMSGKTF